MKSFKYNFQFTVCLLICNCILLESNGQTLKRIFYAKPLCQQELIFESEISPGDEVYIIKYESDSQRYWLANNAGPINFKSYFSKDNSIDSADLYYYFWPKMTVDYIKKRYGINGWKKIIAKKVSIGWPKELCKFSWGEPNKINKTKSSYGNHEQWVYSSGYLYFENGKLTAIQN